MDLLGNIIGLSGHIPMVPSNPAHKLGLSIVVLADVFHAIRGYISS